MNYKNNRIGFSSYKGNNKLTTDNCYIMFFYIIYSKKHKKRCKQSVMHDIKAMHLY